MRQLQRNQEAMREEIEKLRAEVEALSADSDEQASAGQAAERPIDFDGGAKTLGDEGAPVGIVEYTDFQCPYCRRHHNEVFPKIKANLIDSGQVRYQVRDLPLQMHPKAEGAAVAANCAHSQGAYWTMHEALFQRQGQLSTELYPRLAEELGLDKDQFRSCLDDNERLAAVRQSRSQARERGARGTPHFLVGRLEDGELQEVRAISGAQRYAVFERVVKELTP
jgi:protein-disulfide isomerase